MKKYLAFAFFAVAILSSMLREWGAQNACPLPPIPVVERRASPPACTDEDAHHFGKGTEPPPHLLLRLLRKSLGNELLENAS